MPPTPKLKMSNQQFVERQKAAQAIQRGQQQQASPTPAGPVSFQQQGAAAAGVAQQAQTQAAMQEAGQQIQQDQNQAATGQIAKAEQRQMSELAAQRSTADQKRKLEKFAMETGNNMQAERRQIERKSKNQAFANERQLADWTVANAANEQDLQNKFQIMTQATEKQIQTLEMITNRIAAEETRISKGKMNAKDRAQKIKLANMKKAMEDKIRREKEKAAKKGGMMQMAMGAVTVAAGAYLTFVTGGLAAPVGVGLMAQGAGQMAGGNAQAEVI